MICPKYGIGYIDANTVGIVSIAFALKPLPFGEEEWWKTHTMRDWLQCKVDALLEEKVPDGNNDQCNNEKSCT